VSERLDKLRAEEQATGSPLAAISDSLDRHRADIKRRDMVINVLIDNARAFYARTFWQRLKWIVTGR
jgi:hypothetical protein